MRLDEYDDNGHKVASYRLNYSGDPKDNNIYGFELQKEERASMTLGELIQENDEDVKVMIEGKRTHSDTDPMCESVYTGMLFDTPEELRTLEVLYTATSMSYNLPVVVVFLPKGYEIPRR